MTRNRLADETSPYLLQHQHNPVHWWAWGPEALAEAKAQGKPILLSVGYAACHWCHVMAHESFEDQDTADVMNAHFINIKVDREERPDIDAIYMGALQRLGERGGWPLTMFLDTDGRPFWGGTYFPKAAGFGRPSFTHVLREIARIYRDEPEKVSSNAAALVRALTAASSDPSRSLALDDETLTALTAQMADLVDADHGGIKGAPKFPQWSFFALLWRGAIRFDDEAARQAVLTTLTHICQGGIYDHLGGGFARYSVDERWLVPHFEKMLYDNALLIDLLTEAWRETQTLLFKSRIEETVGWISREMIADGGGFAASLDADSEGEEGKFYVWSQAEIVEVLGQSDADIFSAIYDVTSAGNFEGHTILNRLVSSDASEADGRDAAMADLENRLAQMRAKLFERRQTRIRPGWDDKVLADWNGLMIASLARASVVFARPEWLTLARDAFDFVVTRMSEGKRLIHSYRAGQARAPATASDYTNMIWAAIRLHEATSQAAYLAHAEAWAAVLDRHYWTADRGGYHMSADDTPDVIVRLRNAQDDATPNANAVMISNLMALWMLTGRDDYRTRAAAIVSAFSSEVAKSPLAHCGLIGAAFDLNAPSQIAIVGRDVGLESALTSVSMPGAIELKMADATHMPAQGPLAGKTMRDGHPTGYVCVGAQCSLPETDAAAFRQRLIEARKR